MTARSARNLLFLLSLLVVLCCRTVVFGFSPCRFVHVPKNGKPLHRNDERSIQFTFTPRTRDLRVLSSRSRKIITVDEELLEDVERLNAENEDSEQRGMNIPDVAEVSSFDSTPYILAQAALIGVLSGFSVGLFKLSVEEVRQLSYGMPISAVLLPLIPAFGGVAVGILSLAGAFAPGLRGAISEVDAESLGDREWRLINEPLRYLRKSAAAVFTLGTGCSLGPEGPSVEVGMSVSRVCMNLLPLKFLSGNVDKEESPEKIAQRNRLLLSCGASAGVSAGFNAPIAGVFFALEIVQGAFDAMKEEDKNGVSASESVQSTSGNITAILLASVLSALISRAILGNHLVLTLSEYTLRTPLVELPLYILLGATCGLVASVFSQSAKLAQSLFDGNVGPAAARDAIKSLPTSVKPVIGGLLCGVIGLQFPQILFFGYETLNSLLANSSPLSLDVLLSLLVVKILTTALAAGSGLVGGTFAPALFMGAMVGASFHNIMTSVIEYATHSDMFVLELADVPAYAMVGAASVLAALFRAPLMASLLLFELTRDYDVILPLMVSAGVGSLIGDIVEEKIEQKRQLEQRRDRDSVSWGDLSDKKR